MNGHEGKPVKSGIAHGTPLPSFQPPHSAEGALAATGTNWQRQ